MNEIREAPTRAPQDAGTRPLPADEPSLDKILLRFGIDPSDPAFEGVRLVRKERRAPGAFVKAAFIPYLLEGEALSARDPEAPSRGYQPEQIPEAERYAERLRRDDLGAVARRLWESGKPGESAGLVLACARFACEDFLAGTIRRWKPGWGPMGLKILARKAMFLNESPGVLRACVGDVPSSPCDNLLTYMEARCGKDALAAKMTGALETDRRGRVVLASGERRVLARIAPSLRLFVVDASSGIERRWMSDEIPLPDEDRAEAWKRWRMLYPYVRVIRDRLNRTAFDLYISGDGIESRDFAAFFRRPLVASGLTGIVWSQGDADFAYFHGSFRTRTGVRTQVRGDAPVRLAHVAETGEETMREWKETFAAANVRPWGTQTTEPRYDPAFLRRDRYAGVRAVCVAPPFPCPVNFVDDALGSLPPGNGVAHKRPYCSSSHVDFGELSMREIGRRENTLLYCLDILTAEGQARRGNLDVVPALASLERRRLERLLEVARESDQVGFCAALMDILNKKPRPRREDFSI